MSFSERQRELIISGYFRRISAKLKIVIPTDIHHVMYQYFIVYCDTWNVEYSNPAAVIPQDKPNYISTRDNYIVTIYGNHVIKPGECHEWRLKITDKIRYFYIGLIQNDKKIMKQCQKVWSWEQYGFLYHGSRSQVYSPNSIWPDDKTNDYGINIGNNDSIVMKVDLRSDKSIISFVINDKDYGNVPVNIDTKLNYRCTISVFRQSKKSSIHFI